jgi:hypothetical protein
MCSKQTGGFVAAKRRSGAKALDWAADYRGLKPLCYFARRDLEADK